MLALPTSNLIGWSHAEFEQLAEVVMREAQAAGVQPSTETYNILAHKLMVEARGEEAKELVAAMMHPSGTKPNRHTARTLNGDFARSQTKLLVRFCEEGHYAKVQSRVRFARSTS